MAEKFSLKDFLFNKTKVNKIVREIKGVYPQFDEKNFIKKTLGEFPKLELKQRISWITKNLKEFLPKDFRKAAKILLESLPPPNDNTKTDNDFGDFIYSPYAEFIAKYGCNKQNLMFSFAALKEITTRFSAEDAIRYFINQFPQETLAILKKWTKDQHYHIRRLASEGTRPKLPWSQKITVSAEAAIPILDELFFDKTRYVTRSVANHMNDISKINPELVIRTLKNWERSKKQNEKEMDYIISHSLRTLIKNGDKKALEFLKFSLAPQVSLNKFNIKNKNIKIGESLEFTLEIKAQKDENLIIDYLIYFQNKKGEVGSKKVFKLKKLSIKKNQSLLITKKHALRQMSTRKLYSGKHILEIQINGEKVGRIEFQISL